MSIKKNPKYSLKHLSVRVPWHDSAWNGTICNNPKANGACLILKSCALKRNDEREDANKGKSIKELTQENYPTCVGERGVFMADFGFDKYIEHPYAESSPETHGHLKKTNLHFPAYSVSAVPYFWMRKENAVEIANIFELNYDDAREPNLKWVENDERGWLQEYQNQKALLNCFFEHLEEESSLVFFTAKQVPFYESSGRVIMGVGRVKKIIPSEKYEGSNKNFSAAYWEHMVLHSIRPNFTDGFLLPYHDAIKYQEEHPSFDPASLAVIAPPDKRREFSYGSEHVSNDSAIRVLLDCIKSIELAQQNGIGKNHEKTIEWIHNELARIEKLRGHYPGMGAALCAFGIARGHFIAAEIINGMKDDKGNPWLLFETALEKPEGIISKEIAELIPYQSKKLFQLLSKRENSARLKLLQLLSRFDISIEQAKLLYIEEERAQVGIEIKDEEFLANPYLIFEATRYTAEPVTLNTIDLGLFIKNAPKDILPADTVFTDPLSSNRIRAITIQQLEFAALLGHTLLPRKELVKQIRELSLAPKCEINSDYYEIAEETFKNAIEQAEMKNGDAAYQLTHLADCSKIIRQKVDDRINGKRLTVDADWNTLLDEALKEVTKGKPDEQELKARKEKASALREIAESRFSVLIGPAGTGKTTLLTILASHPEIEKKGVLLLAPTGKARVRMNEIAKDIEVTAKTLAQFLAEYKRYVGDIQKYKLSNEFAEGEYETVILDEASMLTEEMLATTLDCLRNTKRFILVGDHRQLPPIGPGRPFVDIIHHLKPEEIETSFPRIGKGYAELTIKRRQGGSKREDIQLAEWFSGEPLEPGADQIIQDIIANKNSQYLKLVSWQNESEFDKKLEEILVDELNLKDIKDIEQFNISLGSTDGRYYNFKQAVEKVEAWQILSPVKEKIFGVKSINRKIHKLFRSDRVKFAIEQYKIPKPLGLEQIVYGDKVINLYNKKRYHKTVWPEEGALNYVANGEIGAVIGQFKTPKHTFKGRPQNTEIEFSSQKGYKYTFKGGEFQEEGDQPLELAYALTVHKSQGSEFDKVFLIVPNPCFLLTREMLYTALTRQKEKVIVLFQGSIFDIKGLSSPIHSDTLQRITNLFSKPELFELDGKYLEKNLIHQASDNKMLRSKSELFIYQRLIDKGLQPEYEKKLVIKEVEKLPDFTLENSDTGETYFWEHCGMMHDKDYVERWEEKYKWYMDNDILPWEKGGGKNGSLIVTYDKPTTIEDGSIRGAISVKELDQIIKDVFKK